MKYQRSNSWGEACEEALQPLGTHFSPLNTVAGTRPDIIPVIHVKDVWANLNTENTISEDTLSTKTDNGNDISFIIKRCRRRVHVIS